MLDWDEPPVTGISSLISHYNVYLEELETDTLLTYSVMGTSAIVLDLHPYYRYSYLIAAYTTSEQPPTSAITIRTDQSGGCL